MITNILIGLVVIVVIFLIVVATRPADFHVTRAAGMSAPAGIVFAQVNDLHKWEAWNPWGKLDPAMKMTYAGSPAGAGASYTWAGNNKVGAGRMTITETRPNELVRLKLEFFKPYKATNTGEFTFQPEGNQTAVTWSMGGTKNFMFKAAGLFMDTDKLIGGQFEKGLADLKSVAEAAAKK